MHLQRPKVCELAEAPRQLVKLIARYIEHPESAQAPDAIRQTGESILMEIELDLCMYVCMYVCMHVCMYACISRGGHRVLMEIELDQRVEHPNPNPNPNPNELDQRVEHPELVRQA